MLGSILKFFLRMHFGLGTPGASVRRSHKARGKGCKGVCVHLGTGWGDMRPSDSSSGM